MHRKSSVPFGSVIKAFLFIIVNILQNFQKFLHDNWSYFQIIANEGQVGFWRKYNTKIQHAFTLYLPMPSFCSNNNQNHT